MRQIGLEPNEKKARRFADYLVTQGLTAHAEDEGDSWAIWVREENQIEEAKQAFEEFRRDSDNARYQGVTQSAEAMRREEMAKQERVQRNVVDVSKRWKRRGSGRRPFVVGMIMLSSIVSIMGNFGNGPRRGADSQQTLAATVISQLSFCDEDHFTASQGDPLVDIRKGQLWRLVTPIFIHLAVLHLLFNMVWLYQLGGQIERLRGAWRLLLLILFIAVVSNVAQALAPVGGPLPEALRGNPFFGGMSGVVYGLLGFIWVKSRLDSTSGMFIDQGAVIILIAWMFICMFGIMGPHIANIAHVAGLAAGSAAGYVSIQLKRAR